MPIKNEERFESIPKVRIAISDAVKKAPAIINKVEKQCRQKIISMNTMTDA